MRIKITSLFSPTCKGNSALHLITNLGNTMMYGLQTSTVFVNFYSKTNQMHRCIKFILFWNDTLHVSAVAHWLTCCATNRKVAGSIPAGVSAFFIDIKSFRSHYGPGVDSASNRNEYQEYFCRCVRLTAYHHPVPLSRNLGALTSWNTLGLSRPVMGLLYLLLYMFRTVFPSIIRSSRMYIQLSDSSMCLTCGCCCVYSLELLMMDRKTVRNM